MQWGNVKSLFTKRPDVLWLVVNWLLCNSGMEDTTGKAKDNSEEADLAALEKALTKVAGEEMKKSK